MLVHCSTNSSYPVQLWNQLCIFESITINYDLVNSLLIYFDGVQDNRGFGKCNAFWSIALRLGFQHNSYSHMRNLFQNTFKSQVKALHYCFPDDFVVISLLLFL